MVQELSNVADSMEQVNTYSEYQRGEGIPILRGFAVEDLATLELAPWARKGGRGAFINLEGTGGTNDAYVCEIPPGGTLNPQHQLFEEMVYIVEGTGATSVWYDENRKVTFEWKKGSLFAIPINAWFQHFNGSGSRAARYLAVTDAPLLINLFHNVDFIFSTPYSFDDRFGGEETYFDGNGAMRKVQFGRAFVWDTNFIADTHAIPLYSFKERGAGGKSLFIELAKNTMAAHISEFPVGTYKKAHRHGPGAHVIILSGRGFSLLWPAGAEPERINWHAGSMVVPPNQWFHQHFNTGTEPARYLALRWGSQRFNMGGAIGSEGEGTDVDVNRGGWQIEYADEAPAIHQTFEQELNAAGATCQMRGLHASCTGQAMLV